MDLQKSGARQRTRQQRAKLLHQGHQHLRETERELDRRLEQDREDDDENHAAQRQQTKRTQMESVAQKHGAMHDQRQQNPSLPFFAIPTIAHDISYPQIPPPQHQPQQPMQHSSFEQPSRELAPNAALERRLQQNRQTTSSQPPPPLPSQARQTPGRQQYQAVRRFQQRPEAAIHQNQNFVFQNSNLPRLLSPKLQAQLSRPYVGVDLNSKSQTEVPEFHFPIDGYPNPRALKSRLARDDGGSKGGQKGQESIPPGTCKSPFSGPITLLHTPNVVIFCILMKNYLRQVFGNVELGAEGILRLETLDLWKVEGVSEGYILLADDACRISMSEPVKTEVWKPAYYTVQGERREEGVNRYERKWLNATVFAVLIPKKGAQVGTDTGQSGNTPVWERDARFFWSILPVCEMLKLAERKGVTVVKDFPSGTAKHKKLSTWLRNAFLEAVNPPHSQDFKNAMMETDYCPSMIDPDNALQRLHQNEFLYFAAKNALEYGSDLSDDRYLLHLHPAEREAASLAELTCAGYLFVKRTFFSAFYEEIYRSNKEIDPNTSATMSGRGFTTHGQQPVRRLAKRSNESADREDTPMSITGTPGTPAAATPAPSASAQSRVSSTRARQSRVRTDTAHQKWLEDRHDLRSRRAKCLVVCWKEFGFLDERKYLDWVRDGGMFENAGAEKLDEDDGRD